jgi:hypothetical protein
MGIRPCDLTNEQWLALRRESEQKAVLVEVKKEPEPVSTNQPGYFRNGVFHPFGESTQGSIANKWEAMADAAKRERDAMFDQKQLKNRQE